jgi:hypothetical protein
VASGVVVRKEPNMTQKSLAEALEETVSFIKRAIDRITRNESAEAEFHNVQAYILNVLELVERDPGINAAADDLQNAVRFFVIGLIDQGDAPRRGRLMREAYLRFHDRLMVARPSEHAQRMGLT